MAVSPKTIANVRRLRLLGPLLGTRVVQNFLKRRVEKSVRGPTDATRESSMTHIWGEVRDASGREIRAQLVTPNGYALTVTASLGIVERLLREAAPEGYRTPSQLMGADYVLSLPGVQWVT
jgi:short subunit dehydrogenase-like uncharacterized protein